MKYWLILCLVLFLFEIFTVQLVSIWFVLSSLVVIVLKALGLNNIFIEVTIFIVLGCVLFYFTKRLRDSFMPNIPTNLDRIIGMEGIIISRIDDDYFLVKVDGKEWRCFSKSDLKEKNRVKVKKMIGNKLEVEVIKNGK